MTVLSELADDLATTERTLRRCVAMGLIVAERPSPRTIQINVGERVYLRSHWPVLTGLRSALRNEHDVRLAILFGSTARGTDNDSSDIDIAILSRSASPVSRLDLQRRLTDNLGRSVQVLDLDVARQQPDLLRQIKRDGRPLIDRDDLASGWLASRTAS